MWREISITPSEKNPRKAFSTEQAREKLGKLPIDWRIVQFWTCCTPDVGTSSAIFSFCDSHASTIYRFTMIYWLLYQSLRIGPGGFEQVHRRNIRCCLVQPQRRGRLKEKRDTEALTGRPSFVVADVCHICHIGMSGPQTDIFYDQWWSMFTAVLAIPARS